MLDEMPRKHRKSLESAANWFASLPEDQQTLLVEQFDECELLSDERAADHFYALVIGIQSLLSVTDEEGVVQTLTELDIEQRVAAPLVDTTADRSISTGAVIEDIESLSQEEFELVVNKCLEDYVSSVPTEEILEDVSLEDESTLEDIRSLIQSAFATVMRDSSPEQIRSELTNEGLSDERARYLVDTFTSSEDDVVSSLVSQNLQTDES
jgi:hypothetical protein